MKVRVYGDAAVVTMRAMIKETYKGEEISDIVRITNTWIKKAGRWECVSTHSSRIGENNRGKICWFLLPNGLSNFYTAVF